MDHARKFYLVDASQLKENKDKSFEQRIKPLVRKEIEGLDQKMANIINDNSLTEDEKVDLYNQTLSKFQSLRETVNLNKNHSLKTEQQQIQKQPEYDPVMGVPKPYKSKANKVLDGLRERNKITFNKRGEISIAGREIKTSNISDLLNTAVNPKAKSGNLAGWREFDQLIKDENLPKSLLYTPQLEDKSASKPPVYKEQLIPAKRAITKPYRFDPYDSPKKTKGKRVR